VAGLRGLSRPRQPGQGLGHRFTVYPESACDDHRPEAELLEVKRLRSDALINWGGSGVCQNCLEGEFRRGSNSLRTGPPSLRLIIRAFHPLARFLAPWRHHQRRFQVKRRSSEGLRPCDGQSRCLRISGPTSARETPLGLAQIKKEIETTTSDYDKEKLQERLAKLAGGVAQIKVGAATETELKEKKHRFDDAVSTSKAAVEEGIVPGGGVALLSIAKALDKVDADDADEKSGVCRCSGRLCPGYVSGRSP